MALSLNNITYEKIMTPLRENLKQSSKDHYQYILTINSKT